MSEIERVRAGSDEVLLGELLAGARLRDAAESAQMSYSTARRRMDEQAFVDRLTAARAELRSAIVRRLDAAVGRALARLETLVDEGETETVQLQASRTLLQHGPSIASSVELRERLEAIETELGLDPRTGWRSGGKATAA